MNGQEFNYQQDRCERYKRLKERRDQIAEIIHSIEREREEGPCNQGPFTGNTRESRTVECINIDFSATQGEAPSVSMYLTGLRIRASEFGRFLTSQLREQMKQIDEAIEKL